VFDQVDLGLKGEHQRANAAAAAMAARLICPEVDEAALRKGLLDVTWPGRLERIEGSPSYLLDAAHNPDGCVRLARYLAESPAAGPRVLLFGAMEDKDHLAMLSALDDEVDAKVYYAPPMDRACSPERLAQIKQGKCAGSLEDAVKEAKALAGSEGEIIVAGSIFVLSEVRALVLGLETDPPLGL